MEGETLARGPAPFAADATRTGPTGLSWQWAAAGAVLLASCGHVAIKLGLVAASKTPVTAALPVVLFRYLLQPEVAFGLFIYGIGTLLWISAVSRQNISFLYPLTAMNYVIVSLGGRFLLGEPVSAMRWAGISVVVFGVALLQLSGKEAER